MEPLKTFFLQDTSTNQTLCVGCVLPDGQVAFTWVNEPVFHGCYRHLSNFEYIQNKLPNRQIVWNGHPVQFRLRRIEDVTGISGTGVVAVGVQLIPGCVVMQWQTSTTSTCWYKNLGDIETLHGHGGKTVLELYDPHNKREPWYELANSLTPTRGFQIPKRFL